VDITPYLRQLVEAQGTDIYFVSGAPPQIKAHGVAKPLNEPPLPPGAADRIALALMNEEQRGIFDRQWEMNFALSIPNLGRFRVNVYRQRGETGIVIRYIPFVIPSPNELHLPDIVKDLVMDRQGLVLIVGATAAGKSTTLASMINYRNSHTSGHILTVEDPIEFIHPHQQSVVSQRELGVDTKSYSQALRNALREAPDVIVIGELIEAESIQQMLNYSQTGHLCLATLHANNARQAIERITHFFKADQREQVLLNLALTLNGIISQRLVRTVDRKLTLATEVLLRNPSVCEYIEKARVYELHHLIESHYDDGMMSFNQSLFNLYSSGTISEEEALLNSDARTDLQLKLRLGSATDTEKSDDFGMTADF